MVTQPLMGSCEAGKDKSRYSSLCRCGRLLRCIKYILKAENRTVMQIRCLQFSLKEHPQLLPVVIFGKRDREELCCSFSISLYWNLKFGHMHVFYFKGKVIRHWCTLGVGLLAFHAGEITRPVRNQWAVYAWKLLVQSSGGLYSNLMSL